MTNPIEAPQKLIPPFEEHIRHCLGQNPDKDDSTAVEALKEAKRALGSRVEAAWTVENTIELLRLREGVRITTEEALELCTFAGPLSWNGPHVERAWKLIATRRWEHAKTLPFVELDPAL